MDPVDAHLKPVGLVVLLLLLTALSACAEAAAHKRVLIVESFGQPPATAGAIAFRTTLEREFGQPVDIYHATLDIARFPGLVNEAQLSEFLKARYQEPKLDLVAVMQAPAARLVVREREHLFSNTPIIITGIERRRVLAGLHRPTTTYVAGEVDLPSHIENILQLLPDTHRIFMISGSSAYDKFWATENQRELKPIGGRVKIEWLEGLTFDDLRAKVANLPAGSVVFLGLLVLDAAGMQIGREEALVRLREVSNVPIFGYLESYVGKGIVGGRLYADVAMGTEAARIAIRILKGEAPSAIVPLVVKQTGAIYDWRELDRWGIPESRLPAGAEVRFRPPSLWEQHKLLIVTGTAIVLFQAALITALLLQRVRRRRAETEATTLSGRLITAHEDERRHLARELHDDLTQRLARLAIDAGRMENLPAAPEGIRPLREDLVRLSEDVHALSYRLHPSVLDDLGLVEALKAECDRITRHGALRVEVDARDVPEALPAEASLCLFRVAQEALSNAARHAHASAVTVLLSPSHRGLQLVVSDNGSGFDPAGSHGHASLGLASMRERVRLLQGDFDIESTGRGTTVVAWVPA